MIAGLFGLAGGIFILPALVALFGPQSIHDAIVVSFFAVLLNRLSTKRIGGLRDPTTIEL